MTKKMKEYSLAKECLVWNPPELMNFLDLKQDKILKIDSEQSGKMDVFSLGLIILYALDKDDFNKKRGSYNIEKDVLEKYTQEIEYKVNEKGFSSILKRMLSFSVESRISINELYDLILVIAEE